MYVRQGWQVLPGPGFDYSLNHGLNRAGQNLKNPPQKPSNQNLVSKHYIVPIFSTRQLLVLSVQ